MSQPDHDQEEEFQAIDGPDFREWEIKSPEMWDLVLDLEAAARIRKVFNGPVAADGSPAYEEARQFLDHCERALRVTLATMIITSYGIRMRGEPESPFEHAGKPRAFGVDSPGPSA